MEPNDQPKQGTSAGAVSRFSRQPNRSGRSTIVLLAGGIGLIVFQAVPFASAEKLPTSLWTRQHGSDWPSFLGPDRNSRSPETGILTDWSNAPPRIVWTRALEDGFGIGSVSRGRFFHFDRRQNSARLSCLNAETGKMLWEFEYEAFYVDLYGYSGGPRCTPIIDGARVYIYGVEGMLHCLDVSAGRLLWKCDTVRQFGVIQNFFGVGSTPVVDQDNLIVIVGGSASRDQRIPPGRLDRVRGNGSGVVAFDKRSGEVRYAITDALASYASPTVATIGARRWCFAFCRGGLLAFDPENGAVDFRYPWRSRKLESVNASTPVVVGNEVFISETYGPGSSLLRVASDGQYETVWRDDAKQRHRAMQAHWNTPIYYQGHLYGCSGRNPPDAQLRCIEWKTGKVMWSQPDRVRTSLLYVDRHAVCLSERGELSLIRLDPMQCDIVSRLVLREAAAENGPSDRDPQQLLRYPCWAAPVLSRGLLYVRGRGRLACLELIPEVSE